MNHTIVKLDDDLYVAWSSVCDAPIEVLDREQLEAKLRADIQDARRHLDMLGGRLRRLDDRGHTALWTDCSPQEFVSGNRAGPDETELTWDQLVTDCRDQLKAEQDYPA